jgi:glycosyltransferase involved in cell wall biosynthesis
VNVLILIPSINPGQGGPVVVLEQFARYQSQDGDKLHVVSFDDPASEWVRTFEYPLTALGPCATFYGYTTKLEPWLHAHAKKYDVVIVHGIWQYQSLAAGRVLPALGVPYVIYTHGMLDPGHHKVGRRKQLKKQLYWWLAESRVLRAAAAVFFTTEEERRIAPKGMWPVRWRHSEIVPYGVEQPPDDQAGQREAFLRRFPGLRGRRILLFLGRFDPKKAARLVIKAFAERTDTHPEVTLVMVGPDDKDEGPVLRSLVPETICDRVLWTGMLLGDEKWGAFRSAETFVIPSHTENYCIAAVEALACGVPVLMSDKVNIHSMVSTQGAGYVENDDLAGCGRLLDRWLATPATEWSAMRGNAVDCYRKNFQMEDAYACYREALVRVADTAKASRSQS